MLAAIVVCAAYLSSAASSPNPVAFHTEIPPVNEFWSEWKAVRPCSVPCGGCGSIERERHCLCEGTLGCPCRGSQSLIESCGTRLCGGSKGSVGSQCCQGYAKGVVNGEIRCVPDGNAVVVAETTSTTTTTTTTTSSPVGSWSEWTAEPNATCSDICGMCGTIAQQRSCLPEGAICEGNSTRSQVCAPALCRMPRSTCCPGYIKGLSNGALVCVAIQSKANLRMPSTEKQSAIVPDVQFQLDEEAVSSEAESMQHDQPTPGLSLDLSSTSIDSAKLMADLGMLLTPTINVEKSAGSTCAWSEWSEVTAECSDTCGMCGVKEVARRRCEPEGCTCSGSAARYEDCGDSLCNFPRVTCCGNYTRGVINGHFVCSASRKEKKVELQQRLQEVHHEEAKQESHELWEDEIPHQVEEENHIIEYVPYEREGDAHNVYL